MLINDLTPGIANEHFEGGGDEYKLKSVCNQFEFRPVYKVLCEDDSAIIIRASGLALVAKWDVHTHEHVGVAYGHDYWQKGDGAEVEAIDEDKSDEEAESDEGDM